MKMKGIILNSEQVNILLDYGDLEYRKKVKTMKNGSLEPIYLGFSPFGDIGNRLFIKEKFYIGFKIEGVKILIGSDGEPIDKYSYLADHNVPTWKDCYYHAHKMKQSQSRLTVEITDIKVEKADVWEWVVNLKLNK